jgi:hypothetical protein
LHSTTGAETVIQPYTKEWKQKKREKGEKIKKFT